jgi:phenylalanine-4-hydroxylase
VFNQHFEIDHFQDVLFVTESFDQLYEAVEEAGRRIGTIR